MQGDETKPSVPIDDDAEAVADLCREDRERLTPKETADCAGMELVREYENEEDGGS